MNGFAPRLLLKAAVVLLLLAARQVASQCTVGSVITTVGAPGQSGSGQYINLDNPATCSGNITAWHFCYFPNGESTFSIEFRVWRRSRPGNTFERVHNDQRTIMNSGSSTSTNSMQLICEDITLTRDEYVRIEVDDVIGVYVPSTSSISVVGVFDSLPDGIGVRLDERGIVDSSFRRNELSNLANSGLYLYVDITAPTTPAVTTPATAAPHSSTTPPLPPPSGPGNTDGEDMATSTSGMASSSGTAEQDGTGVDGNQQGSSSSSQSGNKAGGVAAAVVIVLLLVVGASVAVAIVVLVVCLRKKNKSLTCCCKGRGNGFLRSFDNVIYRVGSDRIPFQVSKTKQESPYDIPRDQHERTLYDIPKSLSNSTANSTAGSAVASHSVIEISTPPSDGLQMSPSSLDTAPVTLQDGNIYEQPIDSSRQPQVKAALGGLVDDPEYIYMSNNSGTADGNEEASKDDRSASSEEDTDSDLEGYISINFDSVEYKKLLKKATNGQDDEDEPHYLAPPSREDEIYVFLSKQRIKVIPRKAITKTSYLGSGEFATVDKGVWEGSKGKRDVAVKTLSKSATEDEKICFLQEAVTMSQFVHPNIVQLYGVVTRGEPVMLVLEHMPKGDLKRFLNSVRPIPGQLVPSNTPKLLLGFSQQAALGMHYLASKGFVHRDLAARNVFVSDDNNCKIGDFGRSRDMRDGYYKGHGGKVPLKWTAPEAIRLKKYSTASDVWSYGCLLYEIWSLGRKPFKGVSNTEAINKISNGYRLPPPPGCPKIVYDLMISCWHPSPGARPKYREVLTVLLGEEYRVLSIPTEDASTSAQASLLGAPIEEGEKMYLNLQGKYLADFNSKRNSDYEYVNTDNEDL